MVRLPIEEWTGLAAESAAATSLVELKPAL
jgi:hypothetical protein